MLPWRNTSEKPSLQTVWSLSSGMDVTPCYRNFSFQETMSSRSNRVKEDIIKEFGSCEAEYILVNGGAPLIKDILAEHYQPLPPCEAHPSYRIFKKVTNNTDPL